MLCSYLLCFFWLRVALQLPSAAVLFPIEQFFNILFESWRNSKTFSHTCICLLILMLTERNLAKPRHAFIENIWLLDPVLEACKNMAACRNKVSQMRNVHFLICFYQQATWRNSRTQEYMRIHGLATVCHKYATETLNIYYFNEVYLPP